MEQSTDLSTSEGAANFNKELGELLKKYNSGLGIEQKVVVVPNKKEEKKA